MRAAIYLALALLAGCTSTGQTHDSGPSFSILSWNVGLDAFESHPEEFRALLDYADPDIVLLDEVSPTASVDKLRAGLPSAEGEWQIRYGSSGGGQRGVIASRMPLEDLPEFAGTIPFPDRVRQEYLEQMSEAEQTIYGRRMDGGISVYGSIVTTGDRRLLLVIVDLECCGGDPASWQEAKRRFEAGEIRSRIRQVLARTDVDGIVVAGDFNLISTAIPLVILTGPYEPPHAGLIAAELYHPDGLTTWTWDGRGTPFPSRALDFQLYGPNNIEVLHGVIIDTEGMSPKDLALHGLARDSATTPSDHRPLLVEYAWR